MQVVRSIRRFSGLAGGCALTIGNFDGLHLGHQAIIETLGERARALGVPTALMTFEPMPRALFTPDDPPLRLSSLREKMEDARALGVDYFVRARFDRAFAALSPDEFLNDLIVQRLNARAILVGEDFRFGHRRSGDINTLRQFSADRGIEIIPLPDVRLDDQRVSSTRVRDALTDGDPAAAARLLGRPYRVSATVVRGQQLGRTLGFPTANLRLHRPAALRYGVYAVWVRLPDGSYKAGAASFGVRPTVDGKEPLLEVFLLDFDGDLYGQRLDVFFAGFVRDEEHYESLDVLITQMHIDVADVRAQLLEQDHP